MAYYQKKPVTVEAFCPADCPVNLLPDWWKEANRDGRVVKIIEEPFGWAVKTLEGEMHARPDDYIIKGIEGELYPCRRDIFEKTYYETTWTGIPKSEHEKYLLEQKVEGYLKLGQDIPKDLIVEYLESVCEHNCLTTNYPNFKDIWDDEEFYENAYDVYRYEVLNWCGCGTVEASNETLYHFLLSTSRSVIYEDDGWAEADKNREKYFGVSSVYDNELLMCLAYTVDAAGLTEHGTSIGSAWLTAKGEVCKYLYEKVRKQNA